MNRYKKDLSQLSIAISSGSHMLEDFEKVSCRLTRIMPSELHSKKRDRPIIAARRICYKYWKSQKNIRASDYSIKELGFIPATQIASVYDQTHATVLHSLRELGNFLSIRDKVTVSLINEFNHIMKTKI